MMNNQDEREGLPSASGIHRIKLCPASYSREKGLPSISSEAAESGTRIHNYLAEPSASHNLSDEELDTAILCSEQSERLINQWAESNTYTEYMRENRMWMTYMYERILSGAPDRIMVRTDADGDHYLVIDYKTGRGEVEPIEENMQIMTLICLLAEHINYKCTTISGTIIQPYASGAPKIVTYGERDIADAELYIIELINDAQKECAPACPSLSACKYCKARTSCPDAQHNMLAVIESANIIKTWATLTPVDKLKLYDNAKLAKKIAESIEANCKDDLKNGIDIPRLKLKDGVKKRTVTDPTLAFNQISHVLDEDQFIKACSVKISVLEKTYITALQETDKDNGIKPRTQKVIKEELSELLTDCIETKITDPSIERTQQ